MRLVDDDTYALYTGDVDTDADTVHQAIDDATQLLEERLRRPLALASRTERLKVYGDRVFPAATPISSVTGPGVVEGDAVRGAPWAGYHVWGGYDAHVDQRFATVTYVGGFTPDTLPVSIRRDISAAAYALIQTRTPATMSSVIPAGATSAKIGDASIGFGPGGYGAAAPVAPGSFDWSPDTLRWRRRTL